MVRMERAARPERMEGFVAGAEEIHIGEHKPFDARQTYGRMYVPIRFLAEAIGYNVGWDEATQTVTLTMGS